MTDDARFRDPDVRTWDLVRDHDILVVCPRCDRCAVVTRPATGSATGTFWPRRLVCGSCAYTLDRDRPPETPGGRPGLDPFFHRPLWLSTRCCGGRELWAYHEPHLDLVERWVAATLRERGPEGGMTLIARLPSWITAAGHRDEILRAIGRLRTRLASTSG